jgi:hypothetical protein
MEMADKLVNLWRSTEAAACTSPGFHFSFYCCLGPPIPAGSSHYLIFWRFFFAAKSDWGSISWNCCCEIDIYFLRA